MKKSAKIAVAAAAPTAVVLMYIFNEQLIFLGHDLGVCTFNILTGLYCPGCGNTRCMTALLHGDLLLAVRNNASLPFLGLLLLCLYIELLFDIFGKPIKILPRKPLVWWIVLGIFAVYFVARNFIPEIAPVPVS